MEKGGQDDRSILTFITHSMESLKVPVVQFQLMRLDISFPLRQSPALTVFLLALPKEEREAKRTERSMTMQMFLGSKTADN